MLNHCIALGYFSLEWAGWDTSKFDSISKLYGFQTEIMYNFSRTCTWEEEDLLSLGMVQLFSIWNYALKNVHLIH